jgi:hypothetical protein
MKAALYHLLLSSGCEEHPPPYQSMTRTVLESILCVWIVASYVPQIVAIRRHGTTGISPYYILNHCLFSTTTFALRLSHNVFYGAFECVAAGDLWAWRGYSALLGFLEVFVQWFCAVVLFAVYIRYRTEPRIEEPRPDEARARRMSDWLPEEMHAHKLSSPRMRLIFWSYIAVTLPVSLAILLASTLAPAPAPGPSPLAVAYKVLWATWISLLCGADAFLVVFQFIKQMKTAGRLRARGSLSLASVAMQSVALILLSVAQFFRSRKNIVLAREPRMTFRRFLGLLFYIVGSVSVDVMYLVAGLGYLVLFLLCVLFDWNDMFERRFGRIQLL